MAQLVDLLKDEVSSPQGLENVFVARVDSDSRQVVPGSLFFALQGTKTQGAQYIQDALKKGAVAVVCSHSYEGPQTSVPIIVVEDSARAYAKACARFFAKQPQIVTAVTGTNGKTSVSVFLREIWQFLGFKAASLGTIGLVAPSGSKDGALTTPDPKVLHQILRELSDVDVTHTALEASSHGLVQRRLDGVDLACAGFTNLTRDHLDYHGTFDAYRSAKMRLFDTLMRRGRPAVIAADGLGSDAFIKCAEDADLKVFTVGLLGTDITLLGTQVEGFGTLMDLEHAGQTYEVHLPLAGTFQVENALVAAGMAICCGGEPAKVFEALQTLKGAPGRLERVGEYNGASVVVDYAHTPDALSEALLALRPYTSGKLRVIFGCGGDRDKGKRPLMGKAAIDGADQVIVTDDNPRSEDAQTIRSAVLAGAVGAHEIGDRGEAIRFGLEQLQQGDVLLIAGKGHEVGQIVGDKVLPFSDKAFAQDIIARRK